MCGNAIRMSLFMALAAIVAPMLIGCSPKGGSAQVTLSPAELCMKTLDPAQGVDACKQAITDSPDSTALRTRLGLMRLKSGSLKAARQAFQVAVSQDNDADAQFGLGLTLEAAGETGGNTLKVEAARRDPGVIGRYRQYGFAEPDLLTFDTAPKIVATPSEARIKALTPKTPLASSLGVDVKCLVSETGQVHDCNVVTPLAPPQQAFGEAARQIVALTKVRPARNNGAPVKDAPILLTMVFSPT